MPFLMYSLNLMDNHDMGLSLHTIKTVKLISTFLQDFAGPLPQGTKLFKQVYAHLETLYTSEDCLPLQIFNDFDDNHSKFII